MPVGASAAPQLLLLEDDVEVAPRFFAALPCLLEQLGGRAFDVVRFGCWGAYCASDAVGTSFAAAGASVAASAAPGARATGRLLAASAIRSAVAAVDAAVAGAAAAVSSCGVAPVLPDGLGQGHRLRCS